MKSAIYRTRKTKQGDVIPAGMNPHSASEAAARKWDGLYKAVVIKTYLTEDEENNISGYNVECDIELIKTQYPLASVPVKQLNHGLNNLHQMWVPKATSRSIVANEKLLQKTRAEGDEAFTFEGVATQPQNYNGDHVIVEFLDSDWENPIITGAYTHRNTKRLVIEGDGWEEDDETKRGTPESEEYYTRHQGTEIRINKNGDLLIDTKGATIDEDTEVPVPLVGGQVRLRIKEGLKFTVQAGGKDVLEVYADGGTGITHIDLGEGASEKLVLGNRMTKYVANHIHPTGIGPTLVPVPSAGGETVTPAGEASFLSAQHKIEDNTV